MRALKNSMRVPIIIPFILLTIATFSIIGYFVFSNWKTSMERIVTENQDNINREILSQIENFIDNPLNINRANHNLIEKEIVDISNKNLRDMYFASIIQSTGEQVYSFTYGTESGEYYGARRNIKNEIEVIENNAQTSGKSRYYSTTPELTAGNFVQETEVFDPRIRDWYKIAKEKDKPVFSTIYKHFVMEDLAISAAYPIHDQQGLLKGVLGTHITLSKINNYLKELVKDNFVAAYIIEKDTGFLVANSLGKPNFQTLANNEFKRATINEINDKTINEAYQKYKTTAGTSYVIPSGSDQYYIKLTEYNKEGLDWLIVTAIPKGPFVAGIIKSIKVSIFISVIAIILAIIIYIKSIEIVLKPVDHLIKTTEKFSSGDFLQRAQVFRNDEIGKLSIAFNKMAEQIHGLITTLEERIKDRTKKLEETIVQLKNSEDDIRLLLDSTAEAIYGVDMKGNCTFCNASCLKILGYQQPEELIGKNMHYTIHGKRRDGTPIAQEECRLVKTLSAGECVHAEDEVFWRSDDTCFPVEYFSYPQYRDGKFVGVVVTFLDITERKKSEAEIVYLSYHDQLTGLYNRRFFEEELRRLDTPRNFPLTIVMADMNGLKLINDSFGHVMGDKLLMKAAEVLTKGCRSGDIVARLGGDEFVILLPKTDCSEAEQIIMRIKNIALKEKVDSISVSISFGCGTKKIEEEIMEEVFKIAEDQMYRNKLFESQSMRGKMVNTIISTLYEKNKREELHSKRVSELCKLMGETLDLPEGDIRELKTVGLLHDIGTIAIEESILNKPGKLTDNEWEEIKRHPEIGYRILSTVNNLSEMAQYVLAHHERWDGNGYPKGLQGTEIPLQSRIINIVDAYDTMTHDTSYRKALTEKEAIAELQKNAGAQFDPALIKIFIEKVLMKP